MSGIEQTFWEFEKGFWLIVIFVAGSIVGSYIYQIIVDIRKEKRHSKLMKQWAKEDNER